MSKILREYLANSTILSEKRILKLRLWFYSAALCLVVVIGCIQLKIDYAIENPLVRLYVHNRWLLNTSWFNAISLVYLPVCIYCDWRELGHNNGLKHVTILNKIRFVSFTSILFPSTFFSAFLFWKLWFMNRDMVAPAAADDLAPFWLQHCLHTVPLLFIILDLFLVPRRRPRNLTFGVFVLTMFLVIYAVACSYKLRNHDKSYPLLGMFSGYASIPLVILIFVSGEHFLYFTLQWLIIDLVFDQKTPTHAVILSILMFRSGQLNLSTVKNDKDLVPSRNAVVTSSDRSKSIKVSKVK